MDKNNIAKQFWIEDPNSKLPRSGCYVVNRSIQSDFAESVAVPLKNIDYDVLIIDNIAKVQLTQTYRNPLACFLEVEYSFPLEPNACLTKFHAKFGDSLLVGRINEKEQSRGQYEQALEQGKQAAYAQIDDSSKDIITIKIGNIPPERSVEIAIQYVQELEVSMSSFWKFTAYSTITPRYLNDKPSSAINLSLYDPKIHGNTLEPRYTWTFQITIRSSKSITFYNSTSHLLTHISMAVDKKSAVVELDRESVPNKDFVLLYATERLGEPGCVVGRTDVNATAVLSFVPKFTQLQINDAYIMAVKSEGPQYNIDSAKGEYLFLLDRSGSMSGGRISKAKQALIFFLKSLPQDCYFQVYSFGSAYSTLFPSSQKYNDESVQFAVNAISTYGADMGGTEIMAPLTVIFKTQTIANYPKQIFLLTDGDVDNTDKIIKLVKDNTHFARMHTIGVGNGASPALIKGCAEKGKGKHIFIQDEENVAAKIIQLLQASLSPVLTNFSFAYDSKMVEAVIPNPSEMPYVLKDEPVSIYVIFKPEAAGSFDFRVSFLNSATNSSFFSTSTVELAGGHEFPFVNKLAHFKALTILADSLADASDKKLRSDIALSQVGDLESYIIEQSIKHQVLSRLTAFVCVEQRLVDGKYQQFKNSKRISVKIPQYESADYDEDEYEYDGLRTTFCGTPLYCAPDILIQSKRKRKRRPTPETYHKLTNVSTPSSVSSGIITGKTFGGESKVIEFSSPPTVEMRRLGEGGQIPRRAEESSRAEGVAITKRGYATIGTPSTRGSGTLDSGYRVPRGQTTPIGSYGTTTNTYQGSGATSGASGKGYGTSGTGSGTTSVTCGTGYGTAYGSYSTNSGAFTTGYENYRSYEDISISNSISTNGTSLSRGRQQESSRQQGYTPSSCSSSSFERTEHQKQYPTAQKPSVPSLFPTSPTKPTSLLDKLISLQKSDGSWSSLEALPLINLSYYTFSSLQKQFGQDDLLLTVLAVAYLEKYYNLPEYVLILLKAKNWIIKESIARNISVGLINQANSLVV